MAVRKPVPAGGAPATDVNNTNSVSAPAEVLVPVASVADTPAASDTPTSPEAPAPMVDAAPAIDAAELVDARVLVAFEGYEPNDLLTAPASEIARLVKMGRVDDDADAVTVALEMQA